MSNRLSTHIQILPTLFKVLQFSEEEKNCTNFGDVEEITVVIPASAPGDSCTDPIRPTPFPPLV